MVSPVVTVQLETPVPEVARLMQERDIGSVVVVDEQGNARGLITEGDFSGMAKCVPFTLALAPVIFGARAANEHELREIYEKARKLRARDVMTEKVASVPPSAPLGQVIDLMMNSKRKHVPVIENGKPVGMVARHDLLKLCRTP